MSTAQAHLHVNGYCICGLTPILTPNGHAAHLDAVSSAGVGRVGGGTL